ncbi:MAG: HNH endonuclease [Ignavibacteria bacterium]|nr:HNH endonuclease [Ignavibacteria bacterium]
MNGKVLVLNQNYEPITICNARRAIILTYLGKAEVISSVNNKVIRTVYRTFEYPSIVRLIIFVRVPFKKIILSRKNIIRRDNHRCQFCGASSNLTIDHIIPKSRGGEDTWENLTTACIKCNNKKGDRILEEAKMVLYNNPKKPSHITFIKNFAGKVDEDWKPYLFM